VETIEDVSGASAANARLARDAPQASPRLSLIHGGREMSDTKRIRLAVALRTGQWALEDLAFDLPKGVVTGDRCREISKAVHSLADAINEYAKFLDEQRQLPPVAERRSHPDATEAVTATPLVIDASTADAADRHDAESRILR